MRAGADCTEPAGLLEASSSTEPPWDDDVILDGRCERKEGLGGANPASSAERCFLPGDIPCGAGPVWNGPSLRAGDFSERLSYCDCVSLRMGDGERVRVPKKSPFGSGVGIRRFLGTSGIESGMGGIASSEEG